MLLQLSTLALSVCRGELPNMMIIWYALSSCLAEKNGSYLQDGNVDNDAAKSYARDKDVAAKLWALTEDLVGQKFDYSGASLF